jgi:quercetin dioxygenase-like cupin family protein
MAETVTEDVVVHRVGEGPGTWAMGSLFEHLVTSSETGGSFAMSLVTQPPGIATPLHRHTREAEAIFVLGGQIEYRAGEETYDLTEGSFLYLPLGLPHAFRIRGDEPARFLGLTAPGGLMGLYDEVGVPAAGMHIPSEGEGRSMEEEIARWNEVGPRYGLQVVGPPLPE